MSSIIYEGGVEMADCEHKKPIRCQEGYWAGAVICPDCHTVLADAPPAHKQPKTAEWDHVK
jgi:hypothetical protein